MKSVISRVYSVFLFFKLYTINFKFIKVCLLIHQTNRYYEKQYNGIISSEYIFLPR